MDENEVRVYLGAWEWQAGLEAPRAEWFCTQKGRKQKEEGKVDGKSQRSLVGRKARPTAVLDPTGGL